MFLKTCKRSFTITEFPQQNQHSFWGSVRMSYAICAFLAMVVHLCMRNTLNFLILCMVQNPNGDEQDNTPFFSNGGQCGQLEHVYSNRTTSDFVIKKNLTDSDIGWSRQQQLSLPSTFYYGYLITLPISGLLTDKFGGKIFFVNAIILQAMAFMMFPVMAKIGYIYAIVIYFVQGLIAGFGNPALYKLFSTWAHPTERTVLLSFAYSGFSVGTLIVFPLSSVFCQLGWESAFYVLGSVALLFGISCYWFVYSTLEDHPRLSKEEFTYLKEGNEEKSQNATVVPWKAISTSVPVYAFFVTHCCHTYGITVLTIILPWYLKEAMMFSIKEVGLYSGVPFLGTLICKVPTMIWYNTIQKKKHSKAVYVVCNCITSLFIMGIIFFTCKHRTFVVLFTLFIGMTTDLAFSQGYWPSLLSLAPTYAGLLSGLATCLATFSGILAPLGISAIVVSGTNDEWNIVLSTLIIAYLSGAISYGCFGSIELQDWGKPNNHRDVDANTVEDQTRF